MDKKMSLTLSVAFGLLALLLALRFASLSAAHAASANTSTKKANYAFTALVTAGENTGTSLTGGLALSVHTTTGNCVGSFYAPESAAVTVNGQITGSQIAISFYEKASDRIIKGIGTASATGYFSGTFNVLTADRQKEVASGIWTALSVTNPGDTLAFALHSVITQGPDKGTVFTAAVVINKDTRMGTFSGPSDGDLASVTATFKDDGEQITASYANGQFIDVGYIDEDQDGYVGTVSVTGTTDTGHWTGDFFTF